MYQCWNVDIHVKFLRPYIHKWNCKCRLLETRPELKIALLVNHSAQIIPPPIAAMKYAQQLWPQKTGDAEMQVH